MIDVLYFASLRERLHTEREQLELDDDVYTVERLKAQLVQRGDAWNSAFAGDLELLVSVNQQMADDRTRVRDGDEIAFFPPVTGG